MASNSMPDLMNRQRRNLSADVTSVWLLAAAIYGAAYWYAAQQIRSTTIWAVFFALLCLVQAVLASRADRYAASGPSDGPLWGALRGVAIGVALFLVVFYWASFVV